MRYAMSDRVLRIGLPILVLDGRRVYLARGRESLCNPAIRAAGPGFGAGDVNRG